MTPDNNWHECGILRKHDGGFVIVNVEEVEALIADRTKYEDWACGKFNWNKGQPLVELPDGRVISIVDVSMTPAK